MARFAIRWGVDRERVVVIHNGVHRADPVARSPREGRLRLVTVSRLIPLKRIDQVLQVVAELEETEFVVIGEGSERARLESLAHDLGIGSRVTFTGQLEQDDALRHVAGADLFVLNSMHEGFPHVLLEAMSRGVPVVATDVGGVGEIVEDGVNGYLIDSENARQLKTQLEELIVEPQRLLPLQEEAIATAKRFSIETMDRATEDVLRRVFAGVAPGATG